MAYLAPGNRGGKVLIFEGHRYQKNKNRNAAIYWRCWRETCRAPLRTNIFDLDQNQPDIHVLSVSEHDHDLDQELINASAVRRRMIERVNQDPESSARQAYDNVAQNTPRNIRDQIPTFDSVRCSLDRERRRHMPNIPATINNVRIEGRWRRSRNGVRFLSKLDNNWGIAVFCTEEALRCLGECRDIFLDGTFKSTPRPYRQLFTIHGYYRDRVIPLVFALMTDRLVGTYRQVFNHLKRRYNRLTNTDLAPDNIISDFEIGLLTASETEFPQARIKGCFFHFCKSIWRKVQKEGLKRQYDRNDDLKKCIRKLMAIAFLPLALVRQNFVLFRQDRTTRRLVRRFPGLTEVFNFFERNYLNGQFLPATWNVYQRDMDNRTNNHVESFNKRWNTVVARKHPNLWYFIKKLRNEESRASLSIAATDRGDAPPPRKRKYRLLQARICRLKNSYTRGQRTLGQYWNAMVYSVAQFQ